MNSRRFSFDHLVGAGSGRRKTFQSFHLKDSLDFDRRVARKGCHANGRTCVLPDRFTKNLNQQIRKAIDDLRLIAKPLGRVYHTEHLYDALNAIEAAKRRLHSGEKIQSGLSGGLGALVYCEVLGEHRREGRPKPEPAGQEVADLYAGRKPSRNTGGRRDQAGAAASDASALSTRRWRPSRCRTATKPPGPGPAAQAEAVFVRKERDPARSGTVVFARTDQLLRRAGDPERGADQLRLLLPRPHDDVLVGEDAYVLRRRASSARVVCGPKARTGITEAVIAIPLRAASAHHGPGGSLHQH